MHILFILDYYKPHLGGSETVFENIITRLIRRGYTISMITSRFDPKLAKVNHYDKLTIHRVGKGRVGFMWSAFWFGLKFLAQNKDVALIHASTYGSAIPASLLGIISKKKVFLTVHEIFGKLWYLYKGTFQGFLYRLFERIIFTLPYDVYHCVSNYTMNSLRIMFGISDTKIRMVYNGVDTNYWDVGKVTEEEIMQWKKENGWVGHYVLLYFGHSGASKGIDYLVEALPELIAQNPDIKIVFNLISAKRDTYIKTEIAKIKKAGGSEYIQVLSGFDLHKLRVLVASADCVVAPSLSEGFGSVHTESCAMSKTLITTNIASIPEVVWGYVRFIKPGSAKEIAKGVEKVKRGDYELILQKDFSWDDTVDEIEGIYKNL